MGVIKVRGKLNVGLGNFGDYFVFLVMSPICLLRSIIAQITQLW